MKSLQVAVVHLLLMFSGKSLAHTVTFYVHNKCPFPIWPATAPNKQSSDSRQGDSNWQPACKTGDCDGRLQCNGLIGKPPATLVQVELKGDKGKPNFYDVSLVDSYNLPISVSTRPFSPKCTSEAAKKSKQLVPSRTSSC
ncbi:hypothetical protein V6N13_122493 [Hibiscus sabdariffa]|uniref:Thaumatin-like protein n=1 Tax=Hibiscus sabdariffa TaxID=183260 RepID=A0ABR2Q756_9ROSI